MKILYHVGTDNIKNKNQFNDAIDYEPKFDNKFSLPSGLHMNPLPIVTFSLRGGKKTREKNDCQPKIPMGLCSYQ